MSDDSFYFKPTQLIALCVEIKAKHPRVARDNHLETYTEEELPDRIARIRVLLSRTPKEALNSLFKLHLKHPRDRRVVGSLVCDQELDIRHKALYLMCHKPGFVSLTTLWSAFCSFYADSETCHYIKTYLDIDRSERLHIAQRGAVEARAQSMSAAAQRLVAFAAAERLSLDALGVALSIDDLQHNLLHDHGRIQYHIHIAILTCNNPQWIIRRDVYYIEIFSKAELNAKNTALRHLIHVFPNRQDISEDLKIFIKRLAADKHVEHICRQDDKVNRWFAAWRSIFHLADFFASQSEDSRERFAFWYNYVHLFTKEPCIIKGDGNNNRDILLMWFSHYGVVEFNEVGATYVYNIDDFERIRNAAKNKNTNSLYKQSPPGERFSHRGDWQRRFRDKLSYII